MDCMSTSTGHGLPQIAKPENPYLTVIWTIFVTVAIGGCIYLTYLTIGQFLEFGVITTTKVKRETEIICYVKICSDTNINDMILDCYYQNRYQGLKSLK